MPRTAASRAPACAGQLQPETAQHLPQRQACAADSGRDRPSACSANVTALHPGSTHRNRRTANAISTGPPPAAPSASSRRVPAVHPRRRPPAPRAPRLADRDRRRDHHRIQARPPADLPARQGEGTARPSRPTPFLGHFQAASGRIAACPRRRHDKMKRQRGSRANRSWQTSASDRSLAATPRRHAAPAPDRDEPAPGRYSAQPITKLAEEPNFVRSRRGHLWR